MKDMKNKIITVIAIVIGILISVYFGFSLKTKEITEFKEGTLGATGGLLAENYIPYIQYNGGYNTAKSIKSTGDITVGSSGTALTKLLSGICTASQPSATFLASTTQEWICADSNISAGDVITANINQNVISTSASNIAFGFRIDGAHATTSGFVGFLISNNTGTGTTSIAAVNRAINYWIADN